MGLCPDPVPYGRGLVHLHTPVLYEGLVLKSLVEAGPQTIQKASPKYTALAFTSSALPHNGEWPPISCTSACVFHQTTIPPLPFLDRRNYQMEQLP